MRVLGIDPGLRCTGFGLIETQGQHLHYLASGTIRTTDAPSDDLPTRIGVLFHGLKEVIEHYQPEVAALELVFVNVNPQATLKLGQARGACLAALVQADLTVYEYTPLQVKRAVAGHGKAAKAQVQEMVRRLLSLPGLPGPDAADALGLAITYAHTAQAMNLARGQDWSPAAGLNYRQGRLA